MRGALYLLTAVRVVVTVERVTPDGDIQVFHAGPEWTWAGIVRPDELTPLGI